MKHPDVMRESVEYYLKTIKRMSAQIDDLDDKITKIESALILKGVSFDGMGVGGGEDAMGEGVASLLELRDEWNGLVIRCADETRAAYELCSPVYPFRWALWLYHVEGYRWIEVARRVGYSEVHVRRNAYRSGVAEIYYAMPEWARRNAFPGSV